ncbi:aconitase X [Tateyamaria armeniaca]|uniref:Aconitase X n=1 Tax=Tateyamaria armeniaca TaxID=2518930 RepID=A0ABW8UX03_9RHOB
MTLDIPTATAMVPGHADAEVLACDEGLSFWGGVDPDTGVIIDAHHPNQGASLAGRIVLMPTSRGSCSGSGVLLQLARDGHAPAALVFREEESILTLGAMIAEQLFAARVVVLRCTEAIYDDLAGASHATITTDTLRFGSHSIPLEKLHPDMLALSDMDRRMLDGHEGDALAVAMNILCRMATAQGAQGLIDVERGHIDGCILAHDANLDFAEKMHQMGARTRIPTTINAISVDRENWQSQGVVPTFGNKASRLADAYVKMGARPTFTCAPYLLEEVPVLGEMIGWSESNAVIYANSVIGARTVKHPDYLDLFIAMTGRAPNTGVYLDDNRLPEHVIVVTLPETYEDALWPMLGWLAGVRSPNAVPLLTGLEKARPSEDDLKALCAAFGTTSAAPLIHLRGHTPEGGLAPRDGHVQSVITPTDLGVVWRDFNKADGRVDLVAIGSPHASLVECRKFADLLEGQKCRTDTIVTVGRNVLSAANAEGIVERLHDADVRIIADICWCSITEPVFPPDAKILMTNSGKYAHYAKGLTGRDVRFGGLADCARAAITGSAKAGLPDWLLHEV